MKGTITAVFAASVLCALPVSSQTPSQTRSEKKQEEKAKEINAKYMGCLQGKEGTYVLSAEGPITYTVVAAPGVGVDFMGNLNKRVEIVTMTVPATSMGSSPTPSAAPDPSNTSSMSSTSAEEGASSAIYAPGNQTLSVQTIRVLPGSCSSEVSTGTKTKTKSSQAAH